MGARDYIEKNRAKWEAMGIKVGKPVEFESKKILPYHEAPEYHPVMTFGELKAAGISPQLYQYDDSHILTPMELLSCLADYFEDKSRFTQTFAGGKPYKVVPKRRYEPAKCYFYVGIEGFSAIKWRGHGKYGLKQVYNDDGRLLFKFDDNFYEIPDNEWCFIKGTLPENARKLGYDAPWTIPLPETARVDDSAVVTASEPAPAAPKPTKARTTAKKAPRRAKRAASKPRKAKKVVDDDTKVNGWSMSYFAALAGR